MTATRTARSTAPVGLDADAIVQTALRLMDEHGVQWLTMRRLAAALDVAASAIYWHVRNKEELWTAVLDDAMASIAVESHLDEPWPDRARSFMHDLRQHLLAHPCVPELSLLVPPGPAQHEMTREAVAIMAAAGFDEDAASRYALIMIWLAFSHPIIETGLRGAPNADPSPSGIRLRSRDATPDLVALGSLSFDTQFATIVDLFVHGLAHELGRADT